MAKELMDVKVTAREIQGQGIAVLELKSISGKDLPEFSAGAHIDVHVTPEITRQYSLCNSPEEKTYYRIGVLNEPESRGGSVTIYNEFKMGKKIKISKPRNNFELLNEGKKVLLIAGGIGITPLIAMAYELKKQARPFVLHYCMRNRNAGAFIEELEDHFENNIFYHCDDEDEQKHFSPADSFQRLERDTHIYVCGPSGFMDWVINAAKESNISDERIHFEYFNVDINTTGEKFEVYCSKSDMIVSVSEEETIVQALYKVGIKVDVSCEQGVCGTCITDVLEGEPDHRDQFLTEEEKEENDQIALCCSRSKSARLVIDL